MNKLQYAQKINKKHLQQTKKKQRTNQQQLNVLNILPSHYPFIGTALEVKNFIERKKKSLIIMIVSPSSACLLIKKELAI